MKRTAFMALFGALALACGGGGGGGGGGTTFKNPDNVTFNFPAGTAPASGSPEASAAASASSSVGSVLSAGTASDANAVGAIANLPTQMAGLFDDSISPENMGNVRASLSRRAAAYLVGDTAAATEGFPAECATVTDTVITFTNCTATFTEAPVTVTETLNGSFHRAAGHVYWDATMGVTVSGVVQNETLNYSFSYHMSGDITFGDGAIKGFERADLSVHAKQGSSLDASAAVTYNVDIDIHYLTTDSGFCISSGTLTVKLVWTEKPHGTGVPAEEQNPSDAAIQFTWTSPSPTSCSSAVTVAVGTPQ